MKPLSPPAHPTDCMATIPVRSLGPVDSPDGILFSLTVEDPQTGTTKSNATFLRFTVIIRHGGCNVMAIPGWRVMGGRLIPPAQHMKSGWYPTVDIDSVTMVPILLRMLEVWRPSLPDVEFPRPLNPPEPI